MMIDTGEIARKAVRVGAVLYHADEVVGPWVHRRAGGEWKPDMPAIGALKGGALVAGVTFEQYNGFNVFAHIAGEGAWASPHVLYHFFAYPFETLGCSRVTAPVMASGEHGARFCLKAGFRPEATLSGAAGDGGDLILFRMLRHECRWIGGARDGQGQHEGAGAA